MAEAVSRSGEPFYDETLQYIENLNAAGVEASVDVYHSDVHSFDLFQKDAEITRQAKQKFLEQFAYALSSYR